MYQKGNVLYIIRLGIILIGIFWLSTQESWAGIPFQINIQGQVTDTTGTPVPDENYNFTFSLFSVSMGGNALFTESTMNYPVTNGIFSYPLGTNTPLTLPFGVPYWLGVQFNSDPEMTPRQEIVSVGNAYEALNSDNAFSAITATYLTSAGNILSGVLDPNLLTGSYLYTTTAYAVTAGSVTALNVALLDRDFQTFTGSTNTFGTITYDTARVNSGMTLGGYLSQIFGSNTILSPIFIRPDLTISNDTIEILSIGENTSTQYPYRMRWIANSYFQFDDGNGIDIGLRAIHIGDGSQLTGLNASNITTGILSSDQLIGNYLNATTIHAYTADSVNNATFGLFAFTASTSSTAIYALTAINASTSDIASSAYNANTTFYLTSAGNILSGTLSDAQLSTNIPLLAQGNTFYSTQTILPTNYGITGLMIDASDVGLVVNATNDAIHAYGANAYQYYGSDTLRIWLDNTNISGIGIVAKGGNGQLWYYPNVGAQIKGGNGQSGLYDDNWGPEDGFQIPGAAGAVISGGRGSDGDDWNGYYNFGGDGGTGANIIAGNGGSPYDDGGVGGTGGIGLVLQGGNGGTLGTNTSGLNQYYGGNGGLGLKVVGGIGGQGMDASSNGLAGIGIIVSAGTTVTGIYADAIQATGNIRVSNGKFIGDGSGLTNLTSSSTNPSFSYTASIATTALFAFTASTASTALYANYAQVAGNASTANNAMSATNATFATTAGLAYNANTATYLTSAFNISTGTLEDARLGANVSLLTANQNYTGINTFGKITASNTWSLITVQSASSTKNIWMLDTVNAPYVNTTVNYALTAGSAPNATSALFAYTASTSSTAIYAIVAGNASTANNAINATNATFATMAGLAYNANTAAYLTSASNISTGTLEDARLSNNVPLLNANQAFTGINVLGKVTANNTWSLTTIQSSLSTKYIWATDTLNGPTYIISTVAYAYLSGTTNFANGNAIFAYTASTTTTLTSAANISGGTLADARLSTNVPLLNANQSFSGTNRFSQLTSNGKTVINDVGVSFSDINAATYYTDYFQVQYTNNPDIRGFFGIWTVAGDGGTFIQNEHYGLHNTDLLLQPRSGGVAIGTTGTELNGSLPSSYKLFVHGNAYLDNGKLYGETTGADNASLLGNQSPSYYQNASNINSGIVADARLSGNVAFLNTDQTFKGSINVRSSNIWALNIYGSRPSGGDDAVFGVWTTNGGVWTYGSLYMLGSENSQGYIESENGNSYIGFQDGALHFKSGGKDGYTGTIYVPGADNCGTQELDFTSGLLTNFVPTEASCPEVDAFYFDKGWVKVGFAIYKLNNKKKEGIWEIHLNKPANIFRLIEIDREISHVKWIKGDGHLWNIPSVTTTPATKNGARNGSVHEFSFEKPVKKLTTFGYYEVIK